MKKILLLFVCLSFLSGCASIVSGGPEVVTINSTPAEAKMTICNERTGQCITVGQTPYAATLERSQGYFSPAKYTITCEKEGYETCTKSFKAGMNGWYAGNILFGGLIGILIVDPLTGAMWDIKEHEIVMNLTEVGSLPDLPEANPEVTPPKEEEVEAVL